MRPLFRYVNLIAVTAIAVIMTVFALAHPSQAEIVYTPVNVVIANNAYSLDLNNDGTTDFTIEGANKSGFCAVPPNYQKHPNDTATIKVLPSPANGVEGGGRAAALDAGSVIGPSLKFYPAGSLMEHVKIGGYLAYRCHHPGCAYCGVSDVQIGNWFDFTGYLGLEFQINGQTHFGWAAVSVQFVNSQVPWTLSATLTGYAYETIAGQSIVAGQTTGP